MGPKEMKVFCIITFGNKPIMVAEKADGRVNLPCDIALNIITAMQKDGKLKFADQIEKALN